MNEFSAENIRSGYISLTHDEEHEEDASEEHPSLDRNDAVCHEVEQQEGEE